MGRISVDEDRLYLQVHGLDVTAPESLSCALEQAIARLPVGLYTESSRSLPEAEVALLREGGLNPEAEPGTPDPMAETAVRFAALIEASLDTSEAAQRLGVHISRVRQLLAKGALYGFRVDDRWRIPAFQFTEHALVPNIGEVNAVLDRGLHPVAVWQWYTQPDPELDVEGTAFSPLAWLQAGYSPEPVRTIAAEL